MTDASMDFFLGEYQSAVDRAWEKIHQDRLTDRLWAKDHTIWKETPAEIADRLGWLDAPAETLGRMDDILPVAEALASQKIRDIFLIGIGGSSLAAEVFSNIFGKQPGYPRLHILDTTDPVFISGLARRMDLERSVLIVSSKSGTTLEVTSLFHYFYRLAHKKLGRAAGDKFFFITDEESPLVQTAQGISAARIFLNNPDIGGRYSALSLTGMVPAALMGVPIQTLLQQVSSRRDILCSRGAALGAALGALAQNGRDKLTVVLPPAWKSFGDWLEQLIAESTGKEGRGILPVLNEKLDETRRWGCDRVFVFFRQNGSPSPMASIIRAGHPVIALDIRDNLSLGEQMFVWEVATAVAAHFLKVNPFDQPDVEATKKHTRELITGLRQNKTTADRPAVGIFDGVAVFGDVRGVSLSAILADFLGQAKAGDYICLQIFLSRFADVEAAVHDLRDAVSLKYAVPVTSGYGPRYLHSTGQLHKGDAGNGLFLQLTQDFPVDEEIPDRPDNSQSSLTFGQLMTAQAWGDFQALVEKKRRIIRLHFKDNPAGALKTIAELL
jgi:glucose-6-phosphate isomerase/transaldolase/glucose-6-phosphate isomerase